MRLIHSRTLEFKLFNENELPPYVILSHTWGAEEISYQDMCFVQKLNSTPEDIKQHSLFGIVSVLATLYNGAVGHENEHSITHGAGYKKIVETAAIAARKGYEYFWCDTVAIDKTSSAELQEAINSMYRWYQEAALCVVYLGDAECPISPEDRRHRVIGDPSELSYFFHELLKSRWVTRGWTLQELLAPRVLEFYDRHWTYFGDKREFLSPITRITGIPQRVLATGDLSQSSIAQKMSWAAGRQTSRTEDIAYSLMGLFGVHMPMLYGEGENAFLRLQEEIMKHTADDSIFAWRASEGGKSALRGLLARSPSEFEDAGAISVGQALLTANTNIGLRLELELMPVPGPYAAGEVFLAKLGALRNNIVPVTLYLRVLGQNKQGTQYCRVNPKDFGFRVEENYEEFSSKVIHVQQVPVVSPTYSTPVMHCFHFRRGDTLKSPPEYYIQKAWPPQFWDQGQQKLLIPEDVENFFGVIWLQHAGSLPTWRCDPFQILLGFHRPTRRRWFKILRDGEVVWPKLFLQRDPWISVIRALGPFDHLPATVLYDPNPTYPLARDNQVICVTISAGLYRDNVSLIVHIDGLQHLGYQI